MNPVEATRQFLYTSAHKHGDLGKRPLSPQQTKVYNLASVGWDPKQIARRLKMHESAVRDAIAKIRHNGWL